MPAGQHDPAGSASAAGDGATEPLVTAAIADRFGPRDPYTPDWPTESRRFDRRCSPIVAEEFELPDASPTAISLEISRAAFECAREVGLALADDPAAVASLSAHGFQGPLLLADSRLSDAIVEEIRRLGPDHVFVAGIDVQLARRALPGIVISPVAFSNEPPVVREVARRRSVWIVAEHHDLELLAALAQQVGASVIAATEDLRALPPAERKAIAAASEVRMLSESSGDASWQIDVIRRGEELPGGGLLMFEPDEGSPGRRLVAAYGHPSTGSLGVLGEQGPEKAVERLTVHRRGLRGRRIGGGPHFRDHRDRSFGLRRL